MFIKHADGKILNVIDTEELDEQAKKKAEKLTSKTNQDDKRTVKDEQCS
jgi:hypothetical protein